MCGLTAEPVTRGVFLLLLLTSGTVAGQLMDGNLTIKLDRKVPGERLSCWTCQTSPDCINLNRSAIEKRTCYLHEFFCKVQKLSYDDGRILLKRSCATKCSHGCFRVITQERCEDCCNTPLCNTGNGARHVTESAWLVSVGSTLFACCLAYIVIPWRTP